MVWNKGIGASAAPAASNDQITNRIHVMRLLLTLLGKEMYLFPQSTSKNNWAIEFTCKLEKKAVLGMMCSFVNITSDYDPTGWAKLPYNHVYPSRHFVTKISCFLEMPWSL